MFLDGDVSPLLWINPVKEGLGDRVVRLATTVKDRMQLAFYLCQRDLNFKQLIGPRATALSINVKNMVSKAGGEAGRLASNGRYQKSCWCFGREP